MHRCVLVRVQQCLFLSVRHFFSFLGKPKCFRIGFKTGTSAVWRTLFALQLMVPTAWALLLDLFKWAEHEGWLPIPLCSALLRLKQKPHFLPGRPIDRNRCMSLTTSRHFNHCETTKLMIPLHLYWKVSAALHIRLFVWQLDSRCLVVWVTSHLTFSQFPAWFLS